MEKTEFFETAVEQGFYGIEKGGLFGKKDNVRKYWEDISIKTAIRRPIVNILQQKEKLRIVDLGSGSGEGYELLTHIPPINKTTVQRDFVLNDSMIEYYLGVDISPAMVKQGRDNYCGKDNIAFLVADLSAETSFLKDTPFDVYFSSYSSPSHLAPGELENLITKIFKLNTAEFVLAIDLFGKYSPEWPGYWDKNPNEMCLYNMSWLFPPGSSAAKTAEEYHVYFWSAELINDRIMEIARKFRRRASVSCFDRSVLVGRHMGTGIYNRHPMPLRLEVNRLFDRDYRGVIPNLYSDISFLDKMKDVYPVELQRISLYSTEWNMTISYLDALINENEMVLNSLYDRAPEELKEEFQMLKWLERNSSRFPVVDFWASIMGPQVACILRNLELSLPAGLGCGHGMFCVVEVN